MHDASKDYEPIAMDADSFTVPEEEPELPTDLPMDQADDSLTAVFTPGNAQTFGNALYQEAQRDPKAFTGHNVNGDEEFSKEEGDADDYDTRLYLGLGDSDDEVALVCALRLAGDVFYYAMKKRGLPMELAKSLAERAYDTAVRWEYDSTQDDEEI